MNDTASGVESLSVCDTFTGVVSLCVTDRKSGVLPLLGSIVVPVT